MSDGGGIVRRVSTREVYRNRWMALREDEIRRPDGDIPWTVLHDPQGNVFCAFPPH